MAKDQRTRAVCAHCGQPIFRVSESHQWRHEGQNPERRDVMGHRENPRWCSSGEEFAEPLPDFEALLREAVELLQDASPKTHDPGLRRSWGQRRRRLVDRITEAMDRG